MEDALVLTGDEDMSPNFGICEFQNRKKSIDIVCLFVFYTIYSINNQKH
jgi:hypothetical protein